MAKVIRVLVVLYALSCLVALLLIPASGGGWFGQAPEPLAAVYAIVLALPWSFLLGLLTGPPPVWLSWLLLAAAMALNIAIALALLRWLVWRRRHRPARSKA